MNDLISFLRTQLDTDEQTARLAPGVVEMFIAPRQNGKTIVSAFLRINTPERALRQVQAHRAILERAQETAPPFADARQQEIHETLVEEVLPHLVSIYSDRDRRWLDRPG